MRPVLTAGCALLAAACARIEAVPGTQVKMEFGRAGFYDAPFPSDDLLEADGTIALDLFPNPKNVSLIQQEQRHWAKWNENN